ncbi:DISARM system helicase DrmA [Spirulina sp. CS-785/01]|uniref:DISARM system helicase DrmA n=1 Tax=Spirulina sp. CS-785/01 TaxID=3021716 RepID=UPI00232FCD0A|nr:DISARM system helicase DrmA [Spirulina sp. CS-785/01]MDB9315712.1 DISARM system helicase DrmA [Spirulina sp. CS-785/01]
MSSAEVRQHLINSLNLDLIGPNPDDRDRSQEIILNQKPSQWYLTGFLVPYEASLDNRSDDTANDDFDPLTDTSTGEDNNKPETASARKAYFPSSIGLSFFLPDSASPLTLHLDWGDYYPYETPPTDSPPEAKESKLQTPNHWRRIPKQAIIPLNLSQVQQKKTIPVPNSDGLEIVVYLHSLTPNTGLPEKTQSVSVFLVNKRNPLKPDERDRAYTFQTRLAVESKTPFIPRADRSGQNSSDLDLRIADLQYREVWEYVVGHNVSVTARVENGSCHRVQTAWLPLAAVEKVVARDIPNVELEMETLATVPDFPTLKKMLDNLQAAYQEWIEQQQQQIASLDTPNRRKIAQELVKKAATVRKRIQDGINVLAKPNAFVAFQIANRAIARSLRQRLTHNTEKDPDTDIKPPRWRPFQLAFILTNLRGIVDPTHRDREIVDLLFFPTGGGKTEAYLGLAAFTLILRRLENPNITSAGMSVLMRYTLRLLTLDQLGRAATLICALELERQNNPEKLGEWPFEIGLWVGMSATPNRMGKKGDNNPDTARAKTIAYQNNSKGKPSPIPLENCPWCGEKFQANSFHLLPRQDKPTSLRINCINRKRGKNRQPRCVFQGDNPLPIIAVDESIYRRLPCFVIATVDKFANLPWVGQTGALFGRVTHYKAGDGFYGSADTTPSGKPLQSFLPPPDLIVQDELHLISGPLGTMVGLYETAIEALCTRQQPDETPIKPKIIASTATVRRAEQQIRNLFSRPTVDVFPPQGLSRKDSFFAQTVPESEKNARLYVGIAAQGRSLKVILLRAYLALLAAAQQQWEKHGGAKNPHNPADPYMTLLGYFNSLRELGGSRRIVEDEVKARLKNYSQRKRDQETNVPFANRTISDEPLELTSRVQTNQVSEAKRRLSLSFDHKNHVDVTLATNMISVGLDVTRLGLMVVLGQPKTAAEYIQATSRVGRDDQRPGLVVTLLNIHRSRDRSHYERFTSWHESFYRDVEATSVTPFSSRARDRGLAGVTVAIARLLHSNLTPPDGAAAMETYCSQMDFVADLIVQRAKSQQNTPGNLHRQQNTPGNLHQLQKLQQEVQDLLNAWRDLAGDLGKLQYQREISGFPPLLRDFLDPELAQLSAREKKFRAQRSLRDVEPSVNIWVKTRRDHQPD